MLRHSHFNHHKGVIKEDSNCLCYKVMLEGVLSILLSCFDFLIADFQGVHSIHTLVLDSMEG
jgi:hypothetical protein